MKIADAFCVPVTSGFFRDDQLAIRHGAGHDGFLYVGAPETEGFSAIREAGMAMSVVLVLDDGQTAVGDCAEVQYAGAGGRAGLLSQSSTRSLLESSVFPELVGREVDSFRTLATHVDDLVVDGEQLPIPIRYGVTQAVLQAAALAASSTMAEVVTHEYMIDRKIASVPIFAQTGDDRFLNVDKMVLKGVDALPHGLINEVDSKLGRGGEILLDYVRWLIARIEKLRRDPTYRPRIHLDTYATVGLAFDGDIERVADYLARLSDVAEGYSLWVEHPIDAGSRDAQVATYVTLREALRRKGCDIGVVVDEWCNTLEDIDLFTQAGAADVIHVKTPDLGGVNNTIDALLMVKDRGFLSYSGGTCNETEVSARVTTQIAMACGADQMLAKPGMGVDEGIMIVRNEMERTLALIERGAHGAHHVGLPA
jgi:methylaspartate ammonia-lyase